MYSFTMKPGNITVLGEETEFNGNMKFTDNLVIAGKFEGTIDTVGNLKIDKTGVCKMKKITADSILIAGDVTGEIEATSKIEMCSGGKIEGDITTVRLRVDDNVSFHGRVTMIAAQPNVDLFSVSAEEYKKSCMEYNN